MASRRTPGRLAALFAALGIAGAAAAQSPDAATLAHKRAQSPVDPLLALWARSGDAEALRSAAPVSEAWPVMLRDGGIVIDAASNGDPRALFAELEALGLRDGRIHGNAVSGLLPLDAVDALAGCASLAVARPALATTGRSFGPPATQRPDDRRGSVVGQGVAAMNVDRLPRRLDGAGARVGILADSFDCLGGGRAQDTASGDLPEEIAILDDPPLAGCRDEGRALAQIVHDVAPGSRLGFHTGFGGQADFAAGIGELADAFGADVIVDDVLYFAEPFFQDGPIARAVEAVHRQGVAYVSAVGNSGRESYEAPFRHSGQTGFFASQGPTGRHDFDPGPGVDVFQTLRLPPGGATVLILQWDEPFVSASTASPPIGAASDYDLLVYRSETPTPLQFSDVFARSTAFNPGGDAFEGVLLENRRNVAVEVYLAIERLEGPGFDGPDVERLKIVAFGTPLEMEWHTQSPTSFGHANAAGAIAVGAAAWFDTPRFGTAPPRLEAFSSAGGVPILFAPSGARRAAPLVRETPDLVAPDGVNTTFFPSPGDVPQDDDALPNFFGSSAAAPHVAGVLALLRAAQPPHSRPVRLEAVLERSAVEMAAPGYDFDTGHGLVDARAAWLELLRSSGPRRAPLPRHRPLRWLPLR